MTFRDLDNNIQLPSPSSMLENWYIDVRDIDIVELSVEDLARACRQNIYPDAVIPYCLRQLEIDPLAGEKYDGELIRAMKSGLSEYWRTHSIERHQFLVLAAKAYQESGNEDVRVAEADLTV